MKRALMVVLLAACAWGQEAKPWVAASASYVTGMGYVNPDFRIGAGADIRAGQWLAIPQASVATADKQENHSGTSLRARSDFYRRIARSERREVWLAGGGVRSVALLTSQWSKMAVWGQAAGGAEIAPGLRFVAGYLFPLRDRRNGVRGVFGELEVPLAAWHGHELRFTGEVEGLSFYPTDQPSAPRLSGTAVGAGLKYLF